MDMWKLTYILILIILAVKSVASKQQVCIIGAGISGLVTAKYFREYPNEFETIIFEKNSNVGGLWIYTDSTTVDQHGLHVHSSIYKNLKTNIVKGVMTFPDYADFGGESGNDSFVKHEDVLEYLKNYTHHFNLLQFIQFNTNVLEVKPLPDLRWLIVAENLNAKSKSKTSCDAVVLCNGHNFKGYQPKIAGIETSSEQVLHSHVYRKPEAFANQTVVVLGAGYSGIDISIDISSAAKKVYLSHRHDKIPATFPPNLEQVPGIVAANKSELILSNGSSIQADTLLFCTGYLFDFAFLDENSGLIVEDGFYIRSIYKHLINIERPTMAIIAVPRISLSFQLPHQQAKYFRAVLRGELSLPSREEMLIEAKLPPNVPKSKVHAFTFDQFFVYLHEFIAAIGNESIPWWFEPVTNEIEKLIHKDPMHYKDKKLVIHENRSIEFV